MRAQVCRAALAGSRDSWITQSREAGLLCLRRLQERIGIGPQHCAIGGPVEQQHCYSKDVLVICMSAIPGSRIPARMHAFEWSEERSP